MGWNKGVDNAECDGCGYKEFSVDPSNHPYWHDELRVKADGAEDRFLYCDKCHSRYQDFLRKQDEAYAVFSKGLR